MPLDPGTKIGPYEITAPLGAGGMGEVYRASDTKLRREVAIKILPGELAQFPDRLARFEREAHLLASLNHPNIAAIYGLEEGESGPCLVLELVEGKTLAELIEDGPVPVEKAMRLGLQIAEALEAAHEKGIIHRDLKPANVKVTPDGTVKVLDFGLAKAFTEDSVEKSVDASLSPTLTMAATQAGIIMGTAAYMSPEQAAGQAADRRSDVWSFGALLMEMVTGRRQFTGETASHILASVLKEEPDWERLPSDLPPRLVELLRACLRKKARDRLQAIGDARVLLEGYVADPDSFVLAAQPAPAPVHEVPAWKRALPWTVAGVLAVGLLGVALWPEATLPREPRRLSIPSPEGGGLMRNYGSSLAISPDGSRIVYVSEGGTTRQLHLQFLDQWEGTLLVEAAANTGPYHPFFSPDGQWVGFVTPSELKKVPVRGGSPITLCAVSFNRGSSWAPDGTIIFAPSPDSGLFRVSEAGGDPQPLTELDVEKQEATHRWPQVLPGGKAVLFTSNTQGSFNEASLEVLDLETGERHVLHRGGSYGRYVESGHIVYVHDGTLFAFPLDLKTLQPTGSAAPVVEGVASNRSQGGAQFAVATDGSLIYLSGGVGSAQDQLVWVDQQGDATPIWDTRQSYGNPTLSPDGTRLAVDVRSEESMSIWIYDLERDVPTRLTFTDGEDGGPNWSPDGEFIYFTSDREGPDDLYRTRSDGSGEAEQVFANEHGKAVGSISPDGTRLAYMEFQGGDGDIWILPLDGGETELWLDTPGIAYGPKFSPDGRWILYGTNESGSFEVYVRPAAGGRGKWQISREGGTYPHWSADGGTIFYRSLPDGGVAAVQVTTEGGTFRAGRPKELFRGPFVVTGDGEDSFDVEGDGERFVMLESGDESTATHEHYQVVLNWFDELERTFSGPGGR